MTLREAIDRVVQDKPASFTSGQVISTYQGRPYVPGKHGMSDLGRQICGIVTESAILPYEKKGRASDGSTRYVRIE